MIYQLDIALNEDEVLEDLIKTPDPAEHCTHEENYRILNEK